MQAIRTSSYNRPISVHTLIIRLCGRACERSVNAIRLRARYIYSRLCCE